MSVAESRAVVQRLVGDFLNKHDLSVADEIFADDLIDHQSGADAVGRGNVKQFVGALFNAFPDLRCEIAQLIAEGDMICAYVIGRGTHRGEFRGVAPTGRSVTIYGTSVMRVAEGKIAERWNVTDIDGLMRQLA